MKKAKKMFIVYAMAAVFVMLTLMVGIINGVSYTMAAQDADEITRMISEGKSGFGKRPNDTMDANGGDRFGGLGPDSPELSATMRYFTAVFHENGEEEITAFAISAVSEKDALGWARTLTGKQETGWTRGTYRYRVAVHKNKTVVTVLDQGRELLPSMRILKISVSCEILGLIVSLLALLFISDRLFRPLEEADRKQKRFIADVEKEFKVPLTVINANTECMERENGASEYTGSINRQVKKMTALVKNLGSLAIFDEPSKDVSQVNLSDIFSVALDAAEEDFAKKGLLLHTDIRPDLTLNAEDEALRKIAAELVQNALKFAEADAAFTLKQEGEHTVITASNDTTLSEGNADRALDRFSRLENAAGKPGAGLGLAAVKDTVKALGGRVTANVAGGRFTVKIVF